MTIVERIVASNLDKGSKIVKLWCVVILNYRQPLGDQAWEAMALVSDRETVHAVALISGLATAVDIGTIQAGRVNELLNEEADW